MHGEWDIKDACKSTAHNLYEGLSHDHSFKLPEGTKNQCSHKNILWIMKLLICFPKYLQYFLLLSYSLFFIYIFFVSLVTIPMYPWHAPTWKKRFNSSQFFTGKKKRDAARWEENRREILLRGAKVKAVGFFGEKCWLFWHCLIGFSLLSNCGVR